MSFSSKFVENNLSVEELKQNFTEMDRHYPIAIYQMGKVGSATILHSLQELNLPNPVFHVHLLSAQNLEISTASFISRNLPLTLQLKHGKILRDYLDSRENASLKVITAVREPIGQLISSVFQNLKVDFTQFIDADENLKVKEIKDYIYNLICQYDVRDPGKNCNWFDREFKQALDIDVYQYQFDPKLAYTAFSKNNLDILVLRLESSQNWSEILTNFLNLEKPLKIIKTNTSDDKNYGDSYKDILSSLKFPVSVLDRIYSSKYCQHFYTKEEIEQFVNKWKMKT
ncbi:putative capsular polysaccharide synthesis family protein [Lyngbya sp. CCY1209]|uniref:putative capsular polysaccharide synthesis family protein n=1 Tax=Lyngbya sp. CCY1209 TaxID=2886103 RepID=UPI002D2001A5|nr:putative capsular polysaccharide synthesis family protein [Lyngbya sp. CCY1209]MEB3886920.1 putative capsular polysaccharide synthesis family protein [Lyngbya sp. CCY1209]